DVDVVLLRLIQMHAMRAIEFCPCRQDILLVDRVNHEQHRRPPVVLGPLNRGQSSACWFGVHQSRWLVRARLGAPPDGFHRYGGTVQEAWYLCSMSRGDRARGWRAPRTAMGRCY